jgi:hypothetical protein
VRVTAAYGIFEKLRGKVNKKWVIYLRSALSQAASTNGSRPFSWGEAMLLVFPSVWITKGEDLAAIKQGLGLALDGLQLGGRAQTTRMVEELVKNSLNDVKWRLDEGLGWVNDGPHSRRNPGKQQSLTDQEFAYLKELLDMISP